jgi:hypothetical protein
MSPSDAISPTAAAGLSRSSIAAPRRGARLTMFQTSFAGVLDGDAMLGQKLFCQAEIGSPNVWACWQFWRLPALSIGGFALGAVFADRGNVRFNVQQAPGSNLLCVRFGDNVLRSVCGVDRWSRICARPGVVPPHRRRRSKLRTGPGCDPGKVACSSAIECLCKRRR